MTEMEKILRDAVYMAKEFYPYSPLEVFAIRYFDAMKREVGYYIPDVDSAYHFHTPRVWSHSLLDDTLSYWMSL